MRRPASNAPRRIEFADILMADVQGELGRSNSRAFERLRDHLRVPSALPSRVTAEIVEMLTPQYLAHTQSFRQSRGAELWAELHWLNQEMLTAAFDKLWMRQDYPLRASALVRHVNAGPAL